jgi:SAM-dependent methyltransferase
MSLLTFLYAVAIFLGSFLLFLIEPIAGKKLLPLLGGSAAVWTTCLVFFQTALLCGYLLAHWMATRLRPRAQAAVYSALLVAALVQGVFSLRSELHASTSHPVLSVFLLLSGLIGLPFLVLSATNPLLQSWFARSFATTTKGNSAGSSENIVPPYRLFALSNFGSLLALVVYPWLVEPRFSLRVQSSVWLGLFLFLVIACTGIASFRATRSRAPVPKPVELPTISGGSTAAATKDMQRGRDRLLWLLLAACGSVLLCSFTNHLSQNVAAIPLLWIVPLIAYLLSFVWAFNGPRSYPRYVMLGLLAVSLGSLGYLLYDTRFSMPLTVTIIFYCVTLLVACVVCHGELYRLRPAPEHATSFYLLIAAGGALGSILVGIVAPLTLYGNYELACGLVFTAAMVMTVTWSSGILPRLFWAIATVVAVALIVVQVRHDRADAIVQVRNFYGTLRVTQTSEPPDPTITRMLMHGTIQHGTQIFSDDLRKTPTSYYAHASGVGLTIDNCCVGRPRRIGVIGLGSGTIAAYGQKGDVIRFYDINPNVEPIARNVFSYIKESGAKVEVVLGDARLSLAGESPQHYDVLVVDAFSGDAIPVHLLTAEAIQLYRRHLNPGGILAVHVSNLFLNLPPVVQEEAEHAGLASLLVSSKDDEDVGAYSSDWVLVTADKDFFARKEIADAGSPVAPLARLRLWTDDYNSLLPLLKHQEFKFDK